MAPDLSLTVVAPTPFFTEGGCSYRVLGETRAFIRMGVSTNILTYPSGRDWPGMHILRPRQSSRKMGIGLNPIRPLYDLELLRLLLRNDPSSSYLHVHLHEGGLLGRLEKALRGHSYLLDLEGSFLEEAARTFPWMAKGLIGAIGRSLEASLESSAGQVVVSSQGLFDALSKTAHIGPDRLHHVPDGVEVSDFTPRDHVSSEVRERLRKKYGFSMNNVVAVYVGGISPQQGINDILETAPEMLKAVPELRFLIYGTASQLNSLQTYQERAKELGLQKIVLFPGPIPYEEVPLALAACDIGLTWKYSVLEGSGKIPLYMAAGIPTVALETPAHRYYLGSDDSRGGIVTKDKDGAAKATIDLALDGSRRTSMGRKAREVAERDLSWDNVAKRLIDLHKLA